MALKRRPLKRAQTKTNVRTYIGIDNGVTGSIGIVSSDHSKCVFFKTPTMKQQNYTKKKGNVNRVNTPKLHLELSGLPNPIAVIERPMVNPGRWSATLSAVRALEATLVVLEILEIPYLYVDSKEWQTPMLPKGTKGPSKLKKASLDIGCRLFPMHKDKYKKDADGMLIAEWARRENL